MEKQGKCQMFIMDRTIVTIGRKWRSKWWYVHCVGCSKTRRRKDGSCKHERRAMETIDPKFLSRVKIGQPKSEATATGE